jgi:hypothetical protein
MPSYPKTFTDANGNKGKVGDEVIPWLVDKYGRDYFNYDDKLVVESIERRRHTMINYRSTKEIYKGEYCSSDRADAYVVVNS